MRGSVRTGRNGRMTARRERVRERESGVNVANGGANVGNERANGWREIVTWNVQRMSVRLNNRNRMSMVVERVIRMGWEVVTLTEMSAESDMAG